MMYDCLLLPAVYYVRVDLDVVDNPEEHRFEALVDGEVAGIIAYRSKSDAIVLVHTQVEPDWGGKGVGSALVSGTLDLIRARGELIVPQCPFVADFLRRHPEYTDLVRP